MIGTGCGRGAMWYGIIEDVTIGRQITDVSIRYRCKHCRRLQFLGETCQCVRDDETFYLHNAIVIVDEDGTVRTEEAKVKGIHD